MHPNMKPIANTQKFKIIRSYPAELSPEEYVTHLLKQIDENIDELHRLAPDAFKDRQEYFDGIVQNLTFVRDLKCHRL